MPTKNEKEAKPACPKCKSKKHVVKTENLHVMAQTFIAALSDEHFCTKCQHGF